MKILRKSILILVNISFMAFSLYSNLYDDRIIDAVRTKNISELNILLNEGASPNALDIKSNKKYSALQVAVMNPGIEIIELLLKFGADVNYINDEKKTALHIACDTFWKKGEKPVFQEGSDSINLRIIKILTQKNCYLDIKDNKSRTALYIAVSNDLNDAVEYLLKIGASPDNLETNNIPVFEAIKRKNHTILDLLLKYNARIDIYGNAGDNVYYFQDMTPLEYAAMIDDGKTVDILLQYKPTLNNKKNNTSPLFYCSSIGMAEKFIEMGFDINQKSYSTGIPLHYAASISNAELILYYLRKNARIDLQGGFKSALTPFFISVVNAHKMKEKIFEVIDLFLKKGANINELDNFKRSSLQEFIKNCSEDANEKEFELKFIQFLIDKGVNIDNLDNDKESVLHMAAKIKRQDIIALLLKNNINAGFINNRGDTYKSILFISKYPNVLEGLGVFGYISLSILPVTNLIGFPFWGAHIQIYDIFLMPVALSFSGLSLIAGTMGSIPISMGFERNDRELINIGIIITTVCLGISYLINMAWGFSHMRINRFSEYVTRKKYSRIKYDFNLSFVSKNDKTLDELFLTFGLTLKFL